MDTDNKALKLRLSKVEAAKSHTRKVAFTLILLAATSFFMVLTGVGV